MYEGCSSLVDQLDSAASFIRRAAVFTEGEYLPQIPRSEELGYAWNDAGLAAVIIERHAARIAILSGAQDALQIAKHALEHIRDGREALSLSVSSNTATAMERLLVTNYCSLSDASKLFMAAANDLQGLADIARIEAMSAQELLEGLLG